MNWINVNEQMPEAGKKVIATYLNSYGKKRTIIASWVPRWTEQDYGDEETASEYNEEKDTYFLKEGWYEQLDNWGDYTSCFVHEGKIAYWMPLPESPKGLL